MFAEMKTIPDYPDYAVTKDGRVWSYRSKRFLKGSKGPYGIKVGLSFEGIKIGKMVHRLVYETFCGYADCVSHKNGDFYDNNLNNLIGRSRIDFTSQVNKNRVLKKILNHKKVIRVDIKTGDVTILSYPRSGSHDYKRIIHALATGRRRTINSKGGLYFLEGDKQSLLDEIKSRIYSNELTLLYKRDTTWNTCYRKYNRHYKRYLEILEKV